MTAEAVPPEKATVFRTARGAALRKTAGALRGVMEEGSPIVTELRIFTINKGQLDDFVRAWTAGVYPLRLKKGYRIEGAWVIRERNEFIWVLNRDGEDWEAQEKAYYDANDEFTGHAEAVGKLTLNETFDAWTGTIRADRFDADGKFVRSLEVPTRATRLKVGAP